MTTITDLGARFAAATTAFALSLVLISGTVSVPVAHADTAGARTSAAVQVA